MHAPQQPQAGTCNHSTAELLCSLALPLSFVSSPPFREVCGPGGPCYRLLPPAFFSHKAEPLLHEEMGDQVRGQGRPRLPLSPWQPGQEHGLLGRQRPLGGRQGASGSPRSQVALGVPACPWAALRRTGCGDSGWGQLGLWLSGRLPAAGLRNIRRPPGVRTPPAGVAGWRSSGHRASLRGETAAGQGGGRLLEPDLQPSYAPMALPMVAEEARAAWAAVGLVQPQLRYPHLSL